MSMQKIGYDGTYMFEVASTGAPAAVLERGAPRRAQRFERTLHGLSRRREPHRTTT